MFLRSSDDNGHQGEKHANARSLLQKFVRPASLFNNDLDSIIWLEIQMLINYYTMFISICNSSENKAVLHGLNPGQYLGMGWNLTSNIHTIKILATTVLTKNLKVYSYCHQITHQCPWVNDLAEIYCGSNSKSKTEYSMARDTPPAPPKPFNHLQGTCPEQDGKLSICLQKCSSKKFFFKSIQNKAASSVVTVIPLLPLWLQHMSCAKR